jgi:hypothetical protein
MQGDRRDAARALIKELEASPTDLARLITRAIVNKDRPVLLIPRQTITAWETRAPEAWAKAREWLVAQGVTIVTL